MTDELFFPAYLDAPPPSDEDNASSPLKAVLDIDTPTPYLGYGYESLIQRSAGSRAMISKDVNAVAHEREDVWDIEKVESLSKLRSVLEVSAGGSFAKMLSGSAKYYKEVTFEERSVYLSIRASTLIEIFRAPSNPISPELLSDLSIADANEIYRKYGDRFVMEVAYGGSFIAIIKFKSKSEEERTTIAAALDGVYGKWTASGDYSKAVEKMNRFTHEVAYIELAGARGGYPSLDKALDYAAGFPEKVAADNVRVPLRLTTRPLNQLEGFPVKHERIDVSSAQTALDSLANQDERFRIIRARWDDVRSMPYHYIDENLDLVARTISSIDHKRDVIGELAAGILFTPAGEIPDAKVPVPPSFERLPEAVPTILPTFIVSCVTVKRNPAKGGGVSNQSRVVPVQDPSNTEANWFPWHAGSYTNIRTLQLRLSQLIPHVEVRYRGLYPQGATSWYVVGENSPMLSAPDGASLLTGIEFQLTGEMADAYWYEYQVHAMKTGDSDIYGNTARATHSDGFAVHATYIEAVRFAIWPK